MSRKVAVLISLLVVLSIAGCSSFVGTNDNTPVSRERVDRESIESISNDVAAEIGKVTHSSQGKTGAPVIVIEENHASRAIQVQEAIILNRLYGRHQIKHIILEGHLKDDVEFKTDWYSKSAGDSSSAKYSVAVNLLQEGEISSAEFIKLIYKDAVIIPAEVKDEYNVNIPDHREVLLACWGQVYQVALTSLRPEHEAKISKMQDEISELEGDPEAQERVKNAAAKYLYSKEPAKLSDDPWIKETTDKLKNAELLSKMSIEEEIAFFEKIQKSDPETSTAGGSTEGKALDDFLTFLKQRSAASKTMVDSVPAIADKPEVYGVAMIIGAGHTERVVALLTSANRPFAVIRPQALDNEIDSSTIPGELYERKMRGLSLYSEGFNKTIQEAVSASSIKPKPIIQQQWFEAKSELYLFTERISERALGGGGGGQPPVRGGLGEAPFGFSDNDFNGRFVTIDPKKIKIVADDGDSGKQAVLFPVEINPSDPARHKTLWVKAGRVAGEDIPSAAEREHVEKLLKNSLHEMDSGGKKVGDKQGKKTQGGEKSNSLIVGKKPRTAVEDLAGRVKVTQRTVAAFASSEKTAMSVVVNRL